MEVFSVAGGGGGVVDVVVVELVVFVKP